jgi:hypothetical protein
LSCCNRPTTIPGPTPMRSANAGIVSFGEFSLSQKDL